MPLGIDELFDDIHECAKETFGEEIVYSPKSGGRFDIIGIFNEIFEQIDPDTERIVASNEPTCGIKLSDIPFRPIKGDIILRPKTDDSFRVVDSREDGEGMSQLFLHRMKKK